MAVATLATPGRTGPAAAGKDPERLVLDALRYGGGDTALAIITRTQGPSYRSPGAIMAIDAAGTTTGSLSSGCIEADLVRHARLALVRGEPALLHYGEGSPWIDLRLPCGGAMEVLIVPRPNRDVIGSLCATLDARRSAVLAIDEHGNLHVETPPQDIALQFRTTFHPPLHMLVFGSGVEAVQFASLSAHLGYRVTLCSPDRDAKVDDTAANMTTHCLRTPRWPEAITADSRTAIALFFHDHDWEPLILAAAVKTPAFWIGAQGSRRARAARDAELSRLGCSAAGIARIKGPIGLIGSARDPRTLAVSVLADIIASDPGRG